MTINLGGYGLKYPAANRNPDFVIQFYVTLFKSNLVVDCILIEIAVSCDVFVHEFVESILSFLEIDKV